MTLRVLTPVYPPEIKPVRPGLYFEAARTHLGYLTLWSIRWDGKRWWSEDGSLTRQDIRWCGLAFDPGAAEPCIDADIIEVRDGAFLPGAVCE